MKKFEVDYRDYFIGSLSVKNIQAGIKYGDESGRYKDFNQALKSMNEKSIQGWEIKSAWQRTEFNDFCLSIVWQREITDHIEKEMMNGIS